MREDGVWSGAGGVLWSASQHDFASLNARPFQVEIGTDERRTPKRREDVPLPDDDAPLSG
jgi:hypothetical protein